MPMLYKMGDIVVLQHALERHQITNRQYLAVCLCRRCQAGITQETTAYIANPAGTAIRRLFGMRVHTVATCEECMLCDPGEPEGAQS